MKKVSVIIPVYGVEKYILQTVQSVLNQTYQEFEILIVDDESPDRSVEICQQLNDPRIKIIHQKNQGISAARNAGIRQATGDYIALLDGDDIWVPEKLAKHVKHLDSSPNVGVSYSYSVFIDEQGKSLGIYQISKTEDITPGLIFCRNPVGNGSTPVIRKEVFEEIKYQENWEEGGVACYFDPSLRHIEDVECWLRMSIKTEWAFEGIPEALTQYRIHGMGGSTKLDSQLESMLRVIEKTRAYAPEVTEQYAKPALAYQLRFLARRAVRLRDGGQAVKYFHQAIATSWRILIDEPRRTILTAGAAYLLWLLPQGLYRTMEEWALKRTGKNQERRIIQNPIAQLEMSQSQFLERYPQSAE
ncbi:glycosyltransferase [Desertifilum sp. FACHB-1129]|nr:MULTISPECIES: glycosyltransferase family 2 protein [unclassified Desertifilum]MBD2310722.1 glycosyltransferase [Desertifilum sp. FACHB-1129]MBD2320759.1 glycosyltransferase [Desertifilum sp. FACHB-866]MBD2330887.1 glycosyltransferase [Desertifilum sp. FACHB-868]MDA0209787.1 glycosyltransferase [Cyanobacteria bacterium FC1]